VIEDVAALAPVSYRLIYDGASYQLLEHGTGTPVPMTGSGTVGDPLRANGIAIVASGAPAAGDQFLIQPLAQSAGSIALAIGSTAEIAAAAPTRTRTGAVNGGTARISAGEVADIADPNLLATATIEFLTATTYSIDGSGSFAYTDGGDILVNGTRVQISGTPAVGDQFIVEANTGGVGDNRNALRLGEALAADTLAGGTTSLLETVSQLVAAVGAQTAEVGFQRDAQTALRTSARESLDSVRGVNLDEEAVKMLEQEQLYQAATRIFAVADDLFQTLIAAIR
jgi:flagellar hook-associated protein 1 FlgK